MVITKEEFDKDFDKYLELSKSMTIKVKHKNKIILVYNKDSYKKYKAFKELIAMYPNGLKIDPSDIR